MSTPCTTTIIGYLRCVTAAAFTGVVALSICGAPGAALAAVPPPCGLLVSAPPLPLPAGSTPAASSGIRVPGTCRLVTAPLHAEPASERLRDQARQQRAEKLAEPPTQWAYLRTERDPAYSYFVRDAPGGTVTGPAEITYARADGLPVVVVTSRRTNSVQLDCPAEWLCLYAGPRNEYPRAVTKACGGVDLSSIGWARRARSVHSNLPGGSHTTGTVGFIRYEPNGEPLGDSNLHKVLILTPASRSAVNPPGADYLYHYCS